MKIEYLAQYNARHGLRLRDRLVAFLPRYAPWLAPIAPLANAAQALGKRFAGFAAERSLPAWRRDVFRADPPAAATGREVVLLVDTFNRYFEPENARAALRVLEAAGYRVHEARPAEGGRPLCCGRTFLAAGLVDQAKREAGRMLDALAPWVERKVPIIGLEPSCLFSLRDEFGVMLSGTEALAKQAVLFEEFLAREADAGTLALELKPVASEALLHGHCHQKAFGAMGAVEQVLRLVPELSVKPIESSCCGMAGSFGYEAEHYGISMKMAEASLLPALRAAASDSLLVADGTSCRHQIADGIRREAMHVARVLERALA